MEKDIWQSVREFVDIPALLNIEEEEFDMFSADKENAFVSMGSGSGDEYVKDAIYNAKINGNMEFNPDCEGVIVAVKSGSSLNLLLLADTLDDFEYAFGEGNYLDILPAAMICEDMANDYMEIYVIGKSVEH